MKLDRLFSPLIGAFLFAATLLLFRVPTSKLLDVVLVQPLFAPFERSAATDVIVLCLLLVIAYWITKTLPRTTIFRATLLGLVFYCFQKFNSYWTFLTMEVFPWLAYWDLVALAVVSLVPLSYCLHRRLKDDKSKSSSEGFIEDNVVETLADDQYNRKKTAEEIADLIVITQNQKSFAIGILGAYGSGKTSFLNLINLELEKEKVLRISYNPWSAGNPETIRREFFDLLSHEIAKYDSKISSLVYSYGRKLASFDHRTSTWLNWLSFFRNSGAAQSSGEYEQINNMLKGLNRKIVISIDDLDRLYPSEILEVLKLIRNTADFSNVFYLVGYDKTYIQEVLKGISETAGLNYLDKIFQLEIPLPKREEDALLIKLEVNLKEILSEVHFQQFRDILIPNNYRSRYEQSYSSVLRQGRDVVRFINGFKIIYKLIGKEVDFESLLLLEMIKFRFPSAYDLIYNQRDLFLYENSMRSSHEVYYVARTVKNKDSEKAEETTSFKIFITELKYFQPEEIGILDGLFRSLFKGSLYDNPKVKHSISYPLYFEIYFRYRLADKDLSDRDYKAALSSDNMQDFMVYCASQGLNKQLMTRLMQEDVFTDRYYFEKVIRSIFIFGRTFVEKEGMFRFNYGALINKISNYDQRLTDKFYKKDIVMLIERLLIIFLPLPYHHLHLRTS